MILQSLYRYYDILLRDPKTEIAPFGYSTVGVSFALNIDRHGELLDVLPLFVQVQRGKKTVERPRLMTVPEQTKRSSNIAPNFLCDNAAYVLGLSDKGGDYGRKRFQEFRSFNIELLKKADCEAARATLLFLDKYNPETVRIHPAIDKNRDVLLRGGNLVFLFEDKFVHDDLVIRQVWEDHLASRDAEHMQCLVTGQIGPVERLHPSLKGIRGGTTVWNNPCGFQRPRIRIVQSLSRAKLPGQ